MTNRAITIIIAALALALAAGCEDDPGLVEIHPEIFVCASPDLRTELCNRPFELGERPIETPSEIQIHIQNRGEAALNVSALTSPDPSILKLVEGDLPLLVGPAASKPLRLTLTPKVLGPSTIGAEVISDDKARSPFAIELRWTGAPRPVPKIELCVAAATPGAGETCGTDVTADFGLVRRSQEESRVITVKNAGTATLDVREVRLTGTASASGELTIATSTRRGTLAPGGSAPVIVVYEPADGLPDTADLVFISDDPMTPMATAHLVAGSQDNFPPIADARHAETASTSIDVAVGDRVVLDGSRSRDPEGDPLAFTWRLFPAARSAATIDDPAAGVVSFTPDRAGSYRVELEVRDSLGQPSETVATVVVRARSRHALRAVLEWQTGGDLDLHLIPGGDPLFGPTDTYFSNPQPNLGDPMSADDDPVLLGDATRAPGMEEIAMIAPAPGTYRIYAHYYDEQGSGPAMASVSLTFDDASNPTFQDTRPLMSRCALWHVGDVVFPGAAFTPSMTAPMPICP